MRGLPITLLVFGFGFLAWRAYTMSTAETSMGDVIATETALLGATIMGTPASQMELSQTGLDAIAAREGYSPYRYADASGYSIGYGHFINPGESFTEPLPEWRAREILAADSKIASDAVRAYVKTPLSQNMFDALVSFVFNVGVGAFKKSTMLTVLNTGDYAAAGAEFDRWHKPAIVIARRDSEKRQFLA